MASTGYDQHLAKGTRLPVTMAVVAGTYYLSAKFGLSLSYKPDYIAALWPPNAILLSVLLLTPPGKWPYYLLAVVPAELAADIPGGIPVWMSLGFMGADWIEVLFAAVLFRRFSATPLQFNSLGQTSAYLIICAILAPFVAAFPGAVATGIDQAGLHYWTRWFRWFMGDALTHLTVTPAIIIWLTPKAREITARPLRFYIEGAVLAAILVVMGVVTQTGASVKAADFPAILYVPLPVLLWISVRFPPRGIFLAALFISLISVWAGAHSHGIFARLSPAVNVVNLQVFLIISLTPLILLATVIEERRLALKQHQTSEERFKGLVASVPGVIYQCENTPRWTMHYISDTVEDITGYPSGDFIKDRIRSFGSIIHPDDREGVWETVQERLGRRDWFEIEYRLLDAGGQIHWVYEKGQWGRTGMGDVRLINGAIFDITERKRAGRALQESERRYQALFNAANDAIFTMMDNRVVDCNQKTQAMFRCSRAQLVGKTPWDFSPATQPDGRSSMQKGLEKLAQVADGKAQVFEWEHLRCDQTRFRAEVSLSANRFSTGLVTQAIVRDVSARKKAEKALRESEESLSVLFQKTPIGVSITTPDGRFLACNEAVARLTGYSETELKAINVTDIYANPEERLTLLKILEEEGSVKEYEMRVKCKDASLLIASISVVPFRYRGEAGFLTVAEDITERKRSVKEREQLINDLRRALSDVKRLSGLLPICASCKKIRDDKGYWNQIEAYIRERSEADFSHGICPECARSLYPELGLPRKP